MRFKIWSGGLDKVVGNPHVYQVPKSSSFIAGRAIGVHEALFNL